MIAGAGTREANARIAAAYDAMPYDTVADENLDPERVLGLGAVYGATAHPGDVLDIGCGTGAQLARAGLQTQGRLAGIDLSQEACRRAREKLNSHGGRGEVLQTDILDITPEHLGAFDLIYAVGVIFIVPPQVRRHILDLIGHCLKPGGVAVLGYYAGGFDLLRSHLHRTLRFIAADAANPQAALARARGYLNHVLTTLPPDPRRELLSAAVRETQDLPDIIFYHEVLNQAFEVQQTSALEQALAPYGLGFASYLAPVPFVGLRTSRERAVAADTLDYSYGSYRHAVFVRCPDTAPDLRRPGMVWASSLVPVSANPDLNQPVGFRNTANQVLTIRNPVTAAMLLQLSAQRLSWAEIVLRSQALVPAQAFTPDVEKTCLADFTNLMAHGHIKPCREIR